MKFKQALLAIALFAAAGTASAVPATYTVDPTHTDVIASWTHMGFSNPSARFGVEKGTIVYDDQAPAKSSVEVTIPLSGMNSFVEKLNEHLNGKDFFDSAQYPVATFRSTAVKSTGTNRLEVTGNLTIKGQTRPVVLDVTLNKKGLNQMSRKVGVGFDATTVIKRSDFGMGAFAPAVSDEVKLRITTEAYAN